jgi:hypothetical protein
MSASRVLLACLLAGLALSVAPRADAEADPPLVYGTAEKPFRRGQFETMRALANFLDGTARNVADTAHETGNSRSRRTRDLLASLDAFSRSAREFHERMDAYEARHQDVPAEVLALERSAKRLNDMIRRAPAPADMADEWRDVVEALSRMKLLLAGLGVQVPPAHRRLPDYDRDYGPFPEGRDQGYDQYQRKRAHGGTDDPDYHSHLKDDGGGGAGSGAPLAGPRLERYKALVQELEVHARRARELADTYIPGTQGYSEALAVKIQRLAVEAARLRERASSGPLDPREMKPVVDRLLEDARATDRKMRQAGAFPKVWAEWSRSIELLDQIASLLSD